MPYSSYKVPVVYVDPCVVSWFILFGNFDSASAALLFSPWIYLIYSPYSSNMILHHNTLSVLKFLYVTFLWLIYFFNC